MRTYIVFTFLVLLFVGWGLHLGLRPLPVVDEPSAAPGPVLTPQPDAGPEPVAPLAESDAGAPAVTGDAAAGDAAVAAPRGLMERPLRVVAPGWSPLAPGLWVNGGLTPGSDSAFSHEGLEVELAVAGDLVAVERALAMGGDQPGGADLALITLPELVVAYPDLEPLELEILLVTGFSNGQHRVTASADAEELLMMGRARLAARRGTSSHFLALFALELIGLGPERVELVAEEADEGAPPPDLWASRTGRRHDGVGARSELLSTREASRLIPWVMVAPRGFIEERGEVIELLSLIWLEASAVVAAEVPAAARRLAEIEGAPGPLELLGPLSQLSPAGLEDNAELAGLSGISPVTLPALFDEAWRLWALAGVVPSSRPPEAPVATATLASVIRAGLARRAGAGSEPDDEAPNQMSERELSALLLVRHLGDDEVARLGLVAGVFAPLPLRARGAGPDLVRLEGLLGQAVDRWSLDPERLRSPTPEPPSGVEVLLPR